MKNDRPEQLPLARTEQLIVKEVDDEVLVYDLKTDQAHCLNKTAALVWKKCDGRATVENIAGSLANEINVAKDERIVWLALDQLEKFNLLESAATQPGFLPRINRRQLVRTIGVATLALPVIFSIASPRPVEAASPCSNPMGRPGGCPCATDAQCASN